MCSIIVEVNGGRSEQIQDRPSCSCMQRKLVQWPSGLLHKYNTEYQIQIQIQDMKIPTQICISILITNTGYANININTKTGKAGLQLQESWCGYQAKYCTTLFNGVIEVLSKFFLITVIVFIFVVSSYLLQLDLDCGSCLCNEMHL